MIYIVDEENDIIYEEIESGTVYKYENKLNPIEPIPDLQISYYSKERSFDSNKNRTKPVEDRNYYDKEYVIFNNKTPENHVELSQETKDLFLEILPKVKEANPENYLNILFYIGQFNSVEYDRFDNRIIFEEGVFSKSHLIFIELVRLAEEKAEDLHKSNRLDSEGLDHFNKQMNDFSIDKLKANIGIKGSYYLSTNTLNAMYEFCYVGKDWLFSERVSLLIDDKKYEFYDLEFNRDNSSDYVWEIAPLHINDKNIELAYKLSESNREDSILRIYGDQYYYDQIINQLTKEAMKKFINLKSIF